MGDQGVRVLGGKLHGQASGFEERAFGQLVRFGAVQVRVLRLGQVFPEVRRDALFAEKERLVFTHHDVAQQLPFDPQRHQRAQVIPVGQDLGELHAPGRKAQAYDGEGLLVPAGGFVSEAQHLPLAPFGPAEQRPRRGRKRGQQGLEIAAALQIQEMGKAVHALLMASLRPFRQALSELVLHGCILPPFSVG